MLLRTGWLLSPSHTPNSRHPLAQHEMPGPVHFPHSQGPQESRAEMLPTSSSTPRPPSLTSRTLQWLITISSCPWAKPQRLLHASPRLSTHPAEAGCPRTGSRAHPQPGRTRSTARAAGGQAAHKAGMLLARVSNPGVGASGAVRRPVPRSHSKPYPLPSKRRSWRLQGQLWGP